MTNFPKVTRQIVLKSRPDGIPQAENFDFAEAKILELADGQILVQNEYLSIDPAMRGWVSAVANYSTPVGIGEVMRSLASGKVVASKHKDYPEGESVTGLFGWQEYAVVDTDAITRKVTETDLPLSLSLGVLGLNGITAYFGLLDNGLPRPGDTVVVSTAAGAVGSAVGQIAKLMGCRTVGIAGGPTKTKLCLDEFGYDVAIDYKASHSIDEPLAAACPDGVEVYFDNTSGPISDAVMARLSVGARVVICGTVSVASWDPPPLGPRVRASYFGQACAGIRLYHPHISTATWRRSNALPNGSATESSVTSKRFPTASNIAREPSPSFIEEKISGRS